MKYFPPCSSFVPVRTVLLVLALGLLGGAVVGTAPQASAQITTDSLFTEDESYYADKYASYDSYSGESSYSGYGAKGVPEPSLLAGLLLAGAGLTYLSRSQVKQRAE